MAMAAEQILIIDDEANIRLTLHTLLTRAGYTVQTVGSGAEALTLLEQESFQLLLIDLKMPGMDGMQVVTVCRDRGIDATVIILTGHGSLETAVAGLRQGIFDYLLKTTDPAEVIDRVRAGLADYQQRQRQQNLLDTVSNAVRELRGDGAAATEHAAPSGVEDAAPDAAGERVLTVGELQIDTWRQAATFANRPLLLTPTEFRVLLCLADHVGKMLTYTEIVRCAQGYEAKEGEASELIKPHIYHLRQKLEPDPGTPRYLLNVRGKGYMLQI